MKTHLVKLALMVWVGAVSVPLVYFHAFHNNPLPNEKPVFESINKLTKKPENLQSWSAVHFITDKCLCSNELAEYLVKRKAQKTDQLFETVVIVGDSSSFEPDLKKAGYQTLKITEEELASVYGITGIPLLVINDEKDQTTYFGGYSERVINKSTAFQDLEILSSLKQGRSIASLPKFGCAVSSKLQNKLDPLKLKYGDWKNE